MSALHNGLKPGRVLLDQCCVFKANRIHFLADGDETRIQAKLLARDKAPNRVDTTCPSQLALAGRRSMQMRSIDSCWDRDHNKSRSSWT